MACAARVRTACVPEIPPSPVKAFTVRGRAAADDQVIGEFFSSHTEDSKMAIAMVILFGLALALAHMKSRSELRPRGRFAPSVEWGQLPTIPRPALPARTRERARRAEPARA